MSDIHTLVCRATVDEHHMHFNYNKPESTSTFLWVISLPSSASVTDRLAAPHIHVMKLVLESWKSAQFPSITHG